MKIVIPVILLLIIQVALIIFSFSVIGNDDSTDTIKMVHFGLIVFNVIFGALNIRTLFRSR